MAARALLFPLLLVSTLHAVEPLATAPTLRQLTQKSGYIFAGTVMEIHKIPPAGPYGVATMQVSVRVDHAIRGVGLNQVIPIREWIGLWKQSDRYHEGERVLLFLYGQSRLGLTSTVNGAFGRFELDANDQLVLDASRAGMLPNPGLKIPARNIPSRSSGNLRGQNLRQALKEVMESER